MTVVDAPPRQHAVFHTLRVATVEPLTDDSVAITFDVPPELRDDYAFLPGQHLTVRMPGKRATYAATTPFAAARGQISCESP